MKPFHEYATDLLFNMFLNFINNMLQTSRKKNIYFLSIIIINSIKNNDNNNNNVWFVEIIVNWLHLII